MWAEDPWEVPTPSLIFLFYTRNMKSANKNVKSTVVATIVRCFGGNFVNRDM